ncbi:MAG: hypothetical protein IJ605_03665, partial [Prevotella sp.]|nr:hypothetical protein [Prevotella sp.]
MKKIKLLSIMLLMSAVAMAADYTAIQLTFQRAGTDVAVTVNDQDGKAISGVTASLESTSFNNVFMTTGAEGITSGQVLAPSGSSTYSNGANAEITYLFKVEGLDGTFSYNSADIDVYGMNKSGNPQSEMERIFHFYVSAGTTENVEDFAVKKEENTTICVSNKNLGLNYTVQNLSTSSEVKTASSPLYIQVKLKKVSSDGCYAGIGAVRLYAKYYTFHRNGNTSAYIYQNSNKMSTGALDNLKMFWWILEPTDNPDRYYIKNATTGKYIQSSKDAGESQLVQMGTNPVEYEVKKNGTYYYLASTDQTVTTVDDVTLGLNFGQQGVVAYWIKTSRANSYWELEEREYTYKH